MPARRKANSGKKSTGRQADKARKSAASLVTSKKTTARKAAAQKTTGRRPTAAEIRAKTPKPKSQLPDRESLTERRKRKSGVADSAITEPKPASNKTTAKGTKAKAQARGNAPKSSSGQTAAQRRRTGAPQPRTARKQNTGGAQAKSQPRPKKNDTSRKSG
ncbi:MAG: hypothetical protein M3323_03045 [Actinomycetota bacterium]|nr:hypothetical protein [Actinomycetota bacterium]